MPYSCFFRVNIFEIRFFRLAKYGKKFRKVAEPLQDDIVRIHILLRLWILLKASKLSFVTQFYSLMGLMSVSGQLRTYPSPHPTSYNKLVSMVG